jgi:hypothetical protein
MMDKYYCNNIYSYDKKQYSIQKHTAKISQIKIIKKQVIEAINKRKTIYRNSTENLMKDCHELVQPKSASNQYSENNQDVQVIEGINFINVEILKNKPFKLQCR